MITLRYRCLLVAIAALLAQSSRAQVESRAGLEAQLRQERGIVPHGTGTWVLQDEIRLRARLDRLPARQDRILAIQRRLDDRVASNRQLWQVGQPQVSALRKTWQALPSDSPRREAVKRRLQQFESQFVDPELLGGMPGVQEQLIELSALRNDLTLDILWLQRQIPLLQKQYGDLQKDEMLQGLLRRIGKSQQLSPLRADYRGDLRRLKQYAKLTTTTWLPIYLQSGRVRVSAIVNDQQAVTFTWKDSGDPTRLTSAMAEAAGLEVPPAAPQIQLRLTNRSLAARRISVPSLRFGGCLLTNVEVDILEPDGEDLGAQIGPAAFEGMAVHCQPKLLRLDIERGE